MSSDACPCPDSSGKFFCERLQKAMTPRLARLCRDRGYRPLFEARRDGKYTSHQKPPQPAWLLCPHRGETIATLPGATLGTGCRTAEQPVYQCGHFHEPVVRRAAASHLERIRAEVPEYMGRTCQRCEIHQAD